MKQSKQLKRGDVIPYTPDADVAAGTVFVKGHLVCVADLDIEAGQRGELTIEGARTFPNVGEAFSAGDEAFWDEDGNPLVGTEGTGAVTATKTGNKRAGFVIEDALATDADVKVKLAPKGSDDVS